MPQMEIYTSYSSGYLQNKVLEAADLVSVILGIFQCFDLHIITHIGVDLHMNDVAYFFAKECFAQGGLIADQTFQGITADGCHDLDRKSTRLNSSHRN